MRGLLIAAAIVVAIAVGVPFAFRVTYPVHETGGIVVTGASSGIGRHAAISLAKRGYLVFAGVRKEKDAKSIRDEGIDTLVPLTLDVTKQDQIDAAFKTVADALKEKKLEFAGLVNNAGISMRDVLEFADVEKSRWIFETNFFGVMATTKAFMPLIRASKGRIVNIGSVTGFLNLPLSGTYSATKWALRSLTHTYRVELASADISCSLIEPAYVKTAIVEKAIADNPFGHLSVKQKANYQDVIDGVLSSREKGFETADGPEVTTEAIEHAITSPHPHTRYQVARGGGVHASVMAWMAWGMPDRVRDALILNMFKKKE